MATATVGDLELFYETFGEPDDVPLLLIAGLGTQGLRWHDEFCQGLADRFFHVIRFDNRDVGESTHVGGPDDVAAFMEAFAGGENPELPYTLSDMAADAVGLLDALGIEAAHVVGMSMGGMIAQLVAIEHPTRVLSLTSIMSNTGNGEFGQPTPEAMEAIFAPAPTERAAAIEHDLKIGQIWANPDFWNEDFMRSLQETQWDRNGGDRTGGARQSMAIIASTDREADLAQLEVPTLVIHGAMDTLVQVSGGERTAEVIPNAELLILENLSHDWPPELFAPVIEAITRHVIASANA